MRHIVKYLGVVLPRSVESWGRQEVVLAFLAYASVAAIIFAAAFGADSSTETNPLVVKGIIALSLAAVVLLVLHVLILTPAKMWDETQKEIKRLREQPEQQPTAPIGFNIGGNATVTIQQPQVSIGGVAPSAIPSVRECWLDESHLRSRTFRIYDIPRDQDAIIRGRSFEDCTIYGPAVLAPIGERSEFRDSTWESSLDATLWEIPEGKRVGAIGIDGCAFRRCRFINVGLAGLASTVKEIRDANPQPP